jgi:hypothetical protein
MISIFINNRELKALEGNNIINNKFDPINYGTFNDKNDFTDTIRNKNYKFYDFKTSKPFTSKERENKIIEYEFDYDDYDQFSNLESSEPNPIRPEPDSEPLDLEPVGSESDPEPVGPESSDSESTGGYALNLISILKYILITLIIILIIILIIRIIKMIISKNNLTN